MRIFILVSEEEAERHVEHRVNIYQGKEDGKKIDVFLEPRSMVALMDDFRYKWTHSIPARKSDKFGNKTIKREKRISLTFRKKNNLHLREM